MDEIDWNDPKFSRWHLSNLGSLSETQKRAIWDDDVRLLFRFVSEINKKILIFQEIDDPPITKNEQIELCKQFECRIELFHSNVCYGVEKSWPRKYFEVADFKSLPSRQQKQIRRTMEKNAGSLYNKYVDPERTKKRIKRRNANVFVPFWEERRCRLRFERIKKTVKSEQNQVNNSIDRSHHQRQKTSLNAAKKPSESQLTTFFNFASNEAVVNAQSKQYTQNDDPTINVDTPSFDSDQGDLDSFSQNFGTRSVYRQPSDHIVTNKTPELIADESVFNRTLKNRIQVDKHRRPNNNATEETYIEDFGELNKNQTSTQKE